MNKYFRWCTYCHGSGIVEVLKTVIGKPYTGDDEDYEGVQCGECNGKAFQPTEEGAELLNFLHMILKAKNRGANVYE